MDVGLTPGRNTRGRQYVRRAPHLRVLERTELLGDCLIYQGADNGKGYGVVGVWDDARERWRVDYAHRVVYEALVGPIPDRHHIDHVRARGCVSKRCVNPEHLEAVTCRENVLRGDRPAQMAEENRDPDRRRGSRRIR